MLRRHIDVIALSVIALGLLAFSKAPDLRITREFQRIRFEPAVVRDIKVQRFERMERKLPFCPFKHVSFPRFR